MQSANQNSRPVGWRWLYAQHVGSSRTQLKPYITLEENEDMDASRDVTVQMCAVLDMALQAFMEIEQQGPMPTATSGNQAGLVDAILQDAIMQVCAGSNLW